MLQRPQPEDGIIATGESHTIREFVEAAFAKVCKTIIWKGSGINERGYDAEDPNKVLVQVDPKYFRPFEVENLRGDASKMMKILSWKPKVTFHELIDIMLSHDLLPTTH